MITILIADDDAVMLDLLTTLMELEGNEVMTVTRPEDIVPAAQQIEPGLILMDYHLAGGDAITPLLNLKEDEKLRDIPVLVTSGMDREVTCRKAGADDFLLKPFRPAQLLEKIRQMIGA
jgi:CheY-like chemotaxis protein